MQVKDIIKLKADFGEYAFFNLEKLQDHPQAKNAAILYFLFDELLQKYITDDYSNKTINLDLLKEQDLFIYEFSTKNKDKKLIIKGLYLKDEKMFSMNCLKKFGQEEMHSAEIKIYDQNLSLDGYLTEQATLLREQIIENIEKQDKNKSQDKREEFRLKPRVIDDNIFERPTGNAPPFLRPQIPNFYNPQQNIRPGIRWDPVMPPGLDPNPNPDPNQIFGIDQNNQHHNPQFYEDPNQRFRSQRNLQNTNIFGQQRYNNMRPF